MAFDPDSDPGEASAAEILEWAPVYDSNRNKTGAWDQCAGNGCFDNDVPHCGNASLRIGFFICIASVLGGETLAAAAGIGKSIALAAELMETSRLYAWIAFVVIASVMLNLMALAAETRSERERGS